jgi:hypothetical protein
MKTNTNNKKNRKTKNTNRNRKTKNERLRNKTRKIKGGNNPFSDFFGLWGTMTYNLSNALSVFSIDPPPSHMNPPNIVDPSPGKQFLNK